MLVDLRGVARMMRKKHETKAMPARRANHNKNQYVDDFKSWRTVKVSGVH
jgi:hypothetical protein